MKIVFSNIQTVFEDLFPSNLIQHMVDGNS